MVVQTRSYRQLCGIAKSLDIVGERWTLLIVRDLLIGPRRYGDLLAGLPGLTTNLLAKRVKDLKANGLVERTPLAPPATSTIVYRLTAAGRELEPVLHSLGAWSWRYVKKPRRGDRADIGWLLFSLKRRFRGAEGPAAVTIVAGTRSFDLRVTAKTWDLEENRRSASDATLQGEPLALRALFLEQTSLADLHAAGKIRVTGQWSAVLCSLRSIGCKVDRGLGAPHAT